MRGNYIQPTCSVHLPFFCFYVPLSTFGPSLSHLIFCSLVPTVQYIHPPCLHHCNVPSLPPSSSSGEVNTISLAFAGWGVLSSQVQGDGRLGCLASAHFVFTGCCSLYMNTKLHWTWAGLCHSFKWTINWTKCITNLLQNHHVKLTFSYKFANAAVWLPKSCCK